MTVRFCYDTIMRIPLIRIPGSSGNFPFYALKIPTEDEAVAFESAEELTAFDEDILILCRYCRHRITSVSNLISVNGNHRHTFINPAGITYQIGCYSSAEGCLVYGYPTGEYTWFSGYSWSLALCAACYSHLGWFYQSATDGFFGLIRNRLIEKIQIH